MDENEFIKDAIFANYTSLRQESIERIRMQSTTIGWIIGITTACIGLLSAGFFECKPKISIAFLCLGYSLIVELFISFWIYQYYHVYVITRDIKLKEKYLKKHFKFKGKINFLTWNIKSAKPKGKPFWFIRNLQPIIMYILSLLSLVIGVYFLIDNKCVLSILYLIVFGFGVFLVIMHFYLSKHCNKFLKKVLN